MLRLRKDQASLWDSVLPEEVLQLSEELTKVDALLDDERFFAPFQDKFATRLRLKTVLAGGVSVNLPLTTLFLMPAR